MKVAFLGTGLMGGLMVQRLLEKGFDVTAYNRTVSKAEGLKAKGAKVVAKSSDAIASCDVTIVMVADFNAVSAVLFNEEVSFKNKTVIQMSTIGPSESQTVQKRVEQSGGEYLEAPVLGGVAQIPVGQLIPMVGGTAEQFNKWKKFLENFAESVYYIGPVGKAASAKLACNQLIATMVSSFAMSLGYVQSEGIDVETFMKIIRPSAYYAPAYDRKLESMLTHDYTNTNFTLKNLLKDVKLAQGEFSKNGVDVTTLDSVAEILKEGITRNLSELDYAALYEVIRSRK
ncbi:MAG: NAD(P)-dependent oxidoreductase [Bacteroidetes bacterium]|nr:NAD(P)-dependent oxidoreductase [Bacteroidota bacterium]